MEFLRATTHDVLSKCGHVHSRGSKKCLPLPVQSRLAFNVAISSQKVVYEIGYGGILYTLLVFVTDQAQPKYRPMAIALTKVPYIASTFAGPRAAQAFYARGLTKLAFGSFLAILPTIAGPVFCILLCQQRKAMATSSPLEARDPRGRSNIFRASARYLRDFDGELSIQAVRIL